MYPKWFNSINLILRPLKFPKFAQITNLNQLTNLNRSYKQIDLRIDLNMKCIVNVIYF